MCAVAPAVLAEIGTVIVGTIFWSSRRGISKLVFLHSVVVVVIVLLALPVTCFVPFELFETIVSQFI
jgi:hypothetical protein